MRTYKIILNIRTEDELYDRFDAKKETLHDDVKSFIESKFALHDFGEKIVIQINSSEELDQGQVKNAFFVWLKEERVRNRNEHHRNNFRQIWMFVIGVIFLAFGILLSSKIGTIVTTILSTIGSFSMWEAASIWIVQNPKIRIKARLLEQLSGTDIIFGKIEKE